MTTKDLLHPVDAVEEEVFRTNPRHRTKYILALAALVLLFVLFV